MIISKVKNKLNSTPYEKIPQWGRIPLFAFFTILIFFILKYSFFLYVGLLDPKGLVYLPILERFNVIQLILDLLIYPSEIILNLLGYETFKTFNSLKIIGSAGVRIAFACLGTEIIFALVALIVAYPGRKKLLFLLIGILGVHVINIGRVIGLTLLKFYNNHWQDPGHTLFNTTGYIFILVIFYLWVKNYSDDVLFLNKSSSVD